MGAYFSWLDRYVAFMEKDVKDFLEILKEAELVVGYNHIWFDLPVLQKYADYDLKQLTNYDIMVEFEKKSGFKAKLDDLCKSNLGTKKTDTYEKYSKYHKEGRWDLLIDYCLHDVKLTEELFQMILAKKEIKYIDALETKQFLLNLPNPEKVNFAMHSDSIF